MKHLVLTFGLIAFVFTVTVSVAHACSDSLQDSSVSTLLHDHGSADTEQKSPCDCDMTCGHGCAHHHVISHDGYDSYAYNDEGRDNIFLEYQHVPNDLIYGLKCPPKS